MADKQSKFDQNIDGAFYVDDQCIACDACTMEAPDFFAMNDDEGHAYVFKQPTTEKEHTDCINALEACPVEAIGKDGND
jgi:ferredoxin